MEAPPLTIYKAEAELAGGDEAIVILLAHSRTQAELEVQGALCHLNAIDVLHIKTLGLLDDDAGLALQKPQTLAVEHRPFPTPFPDSD